MFDAFFAGHYLSKRWDNTPEGMQHITIHGQNLWKKHVYTCTVVQPTCKVNIYVLPVCLQSCYETPKPRNTEISNNNAAW